MKVELAEKAGFCFGVKRAVDTVYREAAGDMPVYTYGPIIHNEEVIADLEQKGVRVVENLKQAEALTPGTIIIRSHGVSQQEDQRLRQSGLHVVDATCPFVKKIHRFVREYTEKGYFIVIVGNAAHPEVQGIVGWSDAEHTAVIQTAQEAANLDIKDKEKVCVVAQTTFNYNKFQDLVEIIRKKGYDIIVHNTICSATQERQKAAKVLSAKVDAMIVIGGNGSSNTRKLYEICSERCKNTYFIQTKEDLDYSDFSRFDYVGITAGASTPNNIIEEVQKYVRNEL